MSGTMMPTMCQILWGPSDPFKFEKRFKNVICHFEFQNMRSGGYHEKMVGRTYFGGGGVCVCVCACACACACAYACACMCVCVCECIRAYIGMYVCVCV